MAETYRETSQRIPSPLLWVITEVTSFPTILQRWKEEKEGINYFKTKLACFSKKWKEGYCVGTIRKMLKTCLRFSRMFEIQWKIRMCLLCCRCKDANAILESTYQKSTNALETAFQWCLIN